MAVKCPQCGSVLKLFLIKSSFVCPTCSAGLKGRIIAPIVATLILWGFADMFISPVFYMLAGDSWSAVMLRTLVSAGVGVPLYAVLVSQFATIEMSNERFNTSE